MMSINEIKECEGGVYVRNWKNALQVHDVFLHYQYSAPLVRCIGTATKRRLLSTSNTHSSNTQGTLAALKKIHEESFLLFGVKEEAFDGFQFRLLQNETSRYVPDDEIGSYVALSYTWHSSNWKTHRSITPPRQNENNPLTPAMWAAFLAQLQDHDFFWVDQLCITQSLELEKIAAVGSMDLVFRAARMIVIALEDIALSTDEANLMCKHATSEENILENSEEILDKLASAFLKLIAARWFDRAWCLHEFLVSKRHVFLVPICHAESPLPSEGSSVNIMRLDGPVLVRMYHVFIRQDIKHQNTSQNSLLQTARFTGVKIDQIRRFFDHLGRLELQEVFGSQGREIGDGSFMHLLHEIFSLHALYNSDKVSIILNAMRSGLYLKVSTPLSEGECLWLVSLIAMAAGDVTALTTTGPRLMINGQEQLEKYRNWIKMPSSGDQLRRRGAFTIPRTELDVRVVEDGLELEILFLGTNLCLKSPSRQYLSIARWLIDHRGLCAMSIDEEEMRLDTEADEAIYASLRVLYIQTLACAFDCGKDWMRAYYAKSYLSLPKGIELQFDLLAKEAVNQAVDWGLATVIQQDISADLNETWQDAGTLMFADDIDQIHEDVDTDLKEESFVHLSQDEHQWYAILLELVERLVNHGLEIFSRNSGSEIEQEVWHVQICNIPNVPGFLIYAPAADTQKPFHLGIPSALWNDEYKWMSRLWLLNEEKTDLLCQRYSLRGKVRLAGICSLPEIPGTRITVVDTV